MNFLVFVIDYGPFLQLNIFIAFQSNVIFVEYNAIVFQMYEIL